MAPRTVRNAGSGPRVVDTRGPLELRCWQGTGSGVADLA